MLSGYISVHIVYFLYNPITLIMPSTIKIIKIDSNNSKQRLDKFLVLFFKNNTILKNFSRGDFVRAIKNKEILVNKRQVKPSYILSENDQVKLNIKNSKRENKLVASSKVEFPILFENANLIAINKPHNLQVHPDNNEQNFTLLNGMFAKYPELFKQNYYLKKTTNHFSVVHRLDKDTSGVIIMAKTRESSMELKKLFKNRMVQKKYLAIVYGIPKKKVATINKPLAKKSNYKKQVIAGQKTKTKIRNAITSYRFIKKIGDEFSLLEVYPKTGRTHQIRVHLFSIGCPIVGDKLYKNKRQKKASATRQLLHAKEIKFNLFNKEYKISAPTPKDFKDFLKD